MITLKQARQLARSAIQCNVYSVPRDFPVYGGAAICIRPCGCMRIDLATDFGGYIIWNDCIDEERRLMVHNRKPLHARKGTATHFLFALSPYYASLLKTLASSGGQGRYFYRNTPEHLRSFNVPYPKST